MAPFTQPCCCGDQAMVFRANTARTHSECVWFVYLSSLCEWKLYKKYLSTFQGCFSKLRFVAVHTTVLEAVLYEEFNGSVVPSV